MALDPLPRIIATTALALPEARTLALAGGGAMIAHGYTERSTHDIDLFTEIDDDEAVQIVVALRLALRSHGIDIRDAAEPRDHQFVAVATDGRTECLVEILSPTAGDSIPASPSTSEPSSTRRISRRPLGCKSTDDVDHRLDLRLW